jgi:hypothetical protein
MDYKNLRPVPKMQDPIRYPKLIYPIEEKVKQDFNLSMDRLLIDVTKKLVGFLKNK